MCKSNGVMRAVSDGGETLWTFMSTVPVQDLAAVNVSSRWWTTFFCINTMFCNTSLGSKLLVAAHHPPYLFDRNWVDFSCIADNAKKGKTPSASSGTARAALHPSAESSVVIHQCVKIWWKDRWFRDEWDERTCINIPLWSKYDIIYIVSNT